MSLGVKEREEKRDKKLIIEVALLVIAALLCVALFLIRQAINKDDQTYLSNDFTNINNLQEDEILPISIWDGTIAEGFARGSGTETDPYIIENAAQFAYFANENNSFENEYIELECDIDLNGNVWTKVSQNTSSKTFKGNFNGIHHKIYNLNTGLFNKLNGIIQNLHIESGNINENSSSNVGAIVSSTSNYYQIINCSNKASVTGYDIVGGILGYGTSQGDVLNCYNEGNITGHDSIGGVVGAIVTSSNVSNCYNLGEITASYNYVGGIVGCGNGGSVSNCYNYGIIVGPSYAGGILGWLSQSSCKNCYNLNNVTSSSPGAIVGQPGSGYSIVNNCYNSGIIKNRNGAKGSFCGSPYNGTVSYKDNYFLAGTVSNTSTGGVIESIATLADMPSVLSVVNGDNAFVEDTNNINNGYPILKWQLEWDKPVNIVKLYVNGKEVTNYNEETKNYTYTLDEYEINFFVEAEFDYEPKQTIGFGKYLIEPGTSQIIELDIISQNKTITKYTLSVDAPNIPEHNSVLKDLIIEGYSNLEPHFSPLVKTYDLKLKKNELYLNIIAETLDNDATVIVEGNKYMPNTEGTITITVTEPNVENTVYTINYQKVIDTTEGSRDNFLRELKVKNVKNGEIYSFDKDFNVIENTYNLNLDPDEVEIIIEATANDDKASVEGLGIHAVYPGESEYEICVTSENNDERIYKIFVNRPKGSIDNAEYKIGDLVDVNKQLFYVFKDCSSEDNMVELISIQNINTTNNNQKSITSVNFSSKNYWSGYADKILINEGEKSGESYLDLNNYNMNDSTWTGAIKMADAYAKAVAGKDAFGRLMTLSEASKLMVDDPNTRVDETELLYMDNDRTKINYWLSSAVDSSSNNIWYVNGTNLNLNSCAYNQSLGVRPIITVPKIKVQDPFANPINITGTEIDERRIKYIYKRR